jgi:branched-chain amino acid transport system ATP-binding protein
MLEIDGLNVHYGGIHALRNASLHVPEKTIVTLVGANGAGKSTLLRAICGLVPATSGSIRFMRRSITGIAPHEITREGIAMSPEGRRVFVNLSVSENLLMGAYVRPDGKEIERDVQWIFEVFPRLKERRNQPAGTLSGGEQQMLALGRALMSRPKLLLLDEPSLGLAPLLIRDVFRVIGEIHREGGTILLIEQNAMAALHVADYGYVMESGEIVLQGAGKDLLADDRVRRAYLGEMVAESNNGKPGGLGKSQKETISKAS